MITPEKVFVILIVAQIIALIVWAMAEQKAHEVRLHKRENDYQTWAREHERTYGVKLPEKSEDFYDDSLSHNVFKYMLKH